MHDILDTIIHFHPDQNCGWDIKVDDEEVFIIESEFPYLELYDCEWECQFKGKGHFKVRKIAEMTAEHNALYWEDQALMYRAEADRYFHGLKRLLDE